MCCLLIADNCHAILFSIYKIFLFFLILFTSIYTAHKFVKLNFRSMLELAQNLVLNEEALNSLPENKRPVFIYEWLCFLNKVLVAAQKVNSLYSIIYI